MPRITVELLRKRSEHNEGIISTLEEISLYQEELERIEVIGTLCRKLRILYLQNNIIEKIEDLTHMKKLRYLNLALNNVSKIEGLAACKFLNKLDRTVNFIDFDTLEENISLDGKDIHESDRIKALQVFKERQRYVREQAARVRAKKPEKAKAKEQENQSDIEADVIEVTTNGATDISSPDDFIEKPKKKSVFKSNEKLKREELEREAKKTDKARRQKMKGDTGDATDNAQRTRTFANQRIALSDEVSEKLLSGSICSRFWLSIFLLLCGLLQILDAANNEKRKPPRTRTNAVNIRGLVPKAKNNQDDESESSLSSSQPKTIATKVSGRKCTGGTEEPQFENISDMDREDGQDEADAPPPLLSREILRERTLEFAF
ncbi:hypothetical protein FI667_g373, partial [Globisporangium splendens]